MTGCLTDNESTWPAERYRVNLARTGFTTIYKSAGTAKVRGVELPRLFVTPVRCHKRARRPAGLSQGGSGTRPLRGRGWWRENSDPTQELLHLIPIQAFGSLELPPLTN